MATLPWRNLKAVSEQKHLIIIGAGGHGKVTADCARATQQFDNIYFLDGEYPNFNKVADWDVVGVPSQFEDFADEQTWFFVAIGHNPTRAMWQKKLLASGTKIATLIHPSTCIGSEVSIGQGSLVLAGAVVNILTDIGQGCIINTAASVDHDCQIGNYCHIAPGVNLAGAVNLGTEVFMGIGSTAVPCVTIGDKTIIGAGATVLGNIQAQVTAVGTPAKVIKAI